MADTRATGKKPGKAAEDAWERLARANRAAAEGSNLDVEEIGDTRRLVDGRTSRIEIEGADHSAEILQLLNDSLAAQPERGDLWMMRFEAQKSLGRKQEFAEGMIQAWKNSVVYRQLDWTVLRSMWQELAPGEQLPAELRMIDKVTVQVALPPTARATPADVARTRRFTDVANQVAGRELAVLARSYAALQAKPGFVDEFAKRVATVLKRPTPLHLSESLTHAGREGARIFLKREEKRGVSAELDHAAAQCYIAVLLGRGTVVTANDVDAHALAVAEMAPRFKLKCTVVVRPDDPVDKRGQLDQLRAHGAQVAPMPATGMLSTDPREGAVRLWQQSAGSTHLVLSLGTAPAPYPAMASNFQALLGREVEIQYAALAGAENRVRTLIAAVTSESDSIGFVMPYLSRREIELVYAEPEPGGVKSWRASDRLRPYNGQIREHAWLHGSGRIEHVALGDATAQSCRERLARNDGIAVSLEDARAVALALLLTRRDNQPHDFIVLVA